MSFIVTCLLCLLVGGQEDKQQGHSRQTAVLCCRLLRENFPNNKLLKVMGVQKFVIPFHVLDLIYSQTVTWVGVFYCPLLPFISLIKLFLVFYIKKVRRRRRSGEVLLRRSLCFS